MTEQDSRDRQLERAALYALGALEGAEKDSFEQGISEGDTVSQTVKEFQHVTDLLGTSVTPVEPPSSLRGRLLARVAAERTPNPNASTTELVNPLHDAGLTFVRATDDRWQEVFPGIQLKSLSFDQTQGRMTALARMAPQSKYEAHRHTAPEEFYVLEGSCFCGGQLLHVGDYHRAEAGTVHYETSSEDGCLMLIIFSPNNEILQSINS